MEFNIDTNYEYTNTSNIHVYKPNILKNTKYI